RTESCLKDHTTHFSCLSIIVFNFHTCYVTDNHFPKDKTAARWLSGCVASQQEGPGFDSYQVLVKHATLNSVICPNPFHCDFNTVLRVKEGTVA
ncbi:hypothetical protein LDENG_00151320, partial [Lucifuga dentata]